MFPCSQSTNTQSTPDRARVLDTFAPGIICQQPIAAPFPSFKAVCSLLAACMVEGMVSALVVVRAVTGECLGKEARASCGRGRRRASSVCMKSGVRQRERSEVAFCVSHSRALFVTYMRSDLAGGRLVVLTPGALGSLVTVAGWPGFPTFHFRPECANSDPLPSEPDGQLSSDGRGWGIRCSRSRG